MNLFRNLRSKQRVIETLCFILFVISAITSCSSPACRAWQFEDVVSKHRCFDSVRLLLISDLDNPYFELELLKTESGTRLYLNILRYRARPSPENPEFADARILFENSPEPQIVELFILEGGQRLLFPDSLMQILVESLLNGEPFVIRMGNNSLSVITDRFAELHEKFFQDLSEIETVQNTI